MAESLASHPAFVALDELQASGAKTEAQCLLLKSKLSKLHGTVLALYASEKEKLASAKGLNEDLLLSKTQLASAGGSGEGGDVNIPALEAEMARAQKEAAATGEKDAMFELQVTELTRQKNEQEYGIEKARESLLAELEPRKRALEGEVKELEAYMEEQRATTGRLEEEREETVSNIGTWAIETKALEATKQAARGELRKVSGEPLKIKKQTAVVEGAKEAMLKEARRVDEELQATVATIVQNAAKARAQEEVVQENHTAQMKRDLRLDSLQADADELTTKISLATQEHDERVQLLAGQHMEMAGVVAVAKREFENYQRRLREKDNALKKKARGDNALAKAKEVLPPIASDIEQEERRLEETKLVKVQQAVTIGEVRKDHEILTFNFLQAGNLEKGEQMKLVRSIEEVKELEAQLAEAAELSRKQARLINGASSLREKAAREVTRVAAEVKEVRKGVGVKDLYVADLEKTQEEMSVKLTEYKKLYEFFKDDRNKSVNLIQAAQQSLTEWKEKLKILQNEIDILVSESKEKDTKLTKSKMSHAGDLGERDQARSGINRHALQYRDQRETLEQQLVEIESLNAVINNIERAMLRLKRHYETSVEDRNYTGIQLIDRNDELCILYEKHNIQEQVLTNGEIELQKRDEEMRRLNRELATYQRETNIVSKFTGSSDVLEDALEVLAAQVEEARAEAERLGDIMESPENDRWRLLPGKDPSPPELAEQIKRFEERLNDKKEQLLEKELVLEEVSSLSGRLREKAEGGRDGTLQLATKVNEFQSQIRSMTKKMMATVSELSMYQGTAMKLQQEKHELELEAQDMAWRLENGEPPTADAEREWDRILYADEARLESRMAPAPLEAEGDEFAQHQVTRTTAEPRPNAYVPEGMMVPKPYGGLAPFKPTAPGRGLAYMRRPHIAEVEL